MRVLQVCAEELGSAGRPSPLSGREPVRKVEGGRDFPSVGELHRRRPRASPGPAGVVQPASPGDGPPLHEHWRRRRDWDAASCSPCGRSVSPAARTANDQARSNSVWKASGQGGPVAAWVCSPAPMYRHRHRVRPGYFERLYSTVAAHRWQSLTGASTQGFR